MDGLYATFSTAVPISTIHRRTSAIGARAIGQIQRDPGLFSAYGYMALDLFYRGAQKAGQKLTTDSLAQSFETTSFPRDMFGSRR